MLKRLTKCNLARKFLAPFVNKSAFLYPTGNYMFKVTIETLEKGEKYIQS